MMKRFKKAVVQDIEAFEAVRLLDNDVIADVERGPSEEDITSSSTTYLSQAFLSRYRNRQ